MFPNIWKLNNKLLSNPPAKEEIIRDIIKYLKLNENNNTSKFVRYC